MTTLDVEIKRRLKTYTKHQEESLEVAPHAHSTDPKNETSCNYVRSCCFHQLRRTTNHYNRSSEQKKHWQQLARAINGAKQSKISQEHFSTLGTQAENCTKATRNLVFSHDAIFRTRVMHRRVFNAICKGQCANEKLHRIRRFTMPLMQIISCMKTTNAHLRQWKTKHIP